LQDYPQSARAAGERGDVTLDFVVATDGSVTDITVSQSSRFADLDEAARVCVAKWRYQPVPNEGGWQASVGWRGPGE
jgi:protein TonB